MVGTVGSGLQVLPELRGVEGVNAARVIQRLAERDPVSMGNLTLRQPPREGVLEAQDVFRHEAHEQRGEVGLAATVHEHQLVGSHALRALTTGQAAGVHEGLPRGVRKRFVTALGMAGGTHPLAAARHADGHDHARAIQ